MTTQSTPCDVRIKKYPSNWEIFVASSGDDGELFQGQMNISLDGLDEEDRREKENAIEELANLATVEEIEKFMDSNPEEGMHWNCIANDAR